MEMDRNTPVEFTPEGFAKAAEAMTFLPEQMRTMMLTMLVMNLCM